ncbi:MAG: 3-oxoacyl-ACP reductase FabG [Gammaproteobacteria bacterium]
MMLAEQVALVTGATRGIGAAIADLLGAEGAWVIGTGTTPEGAEGIAERFHQRGIVGRGIVLDVTNTASVEALFARLQTEERLPTILVNNAGVTRDNLLLRTQDREWEAVLDTNLTGVFRVSRICVKHMMRARRGRIINISSVVAASGNPGQANYCAAKAGVIGFTKALARELGSRGITVNAVAPGFIDTDMTQGLSPDQRDTLVRQIPLNRLGRTEEVAAAVLFLASPGAAYITGETLHVNGGMYMS